MLNVLGAETAISRSNLSLESQETRLRISGEETLGTEYVNASEEYIEFAQQGAEHMIAVVDEEFSIAPGSPPPPRSRIGDRRGLFKPRGVAAGR